MTPNNIFLIGDGMVGKASRYSLGILDYTSTPADKYSWNINDYKYFMLCVPTPTKDGKQDLSAIESWLKKINTRLESAPEPVVIIRSTILPGTTVKLADEYKLTIAHIPEFLSESTAIEDEKNPEFVVIGCQDILVREDLRYFFKVKLNLEDDRIFTCDPTTAELIKYAMNSFFALKVIYGNQIWEVAKETGANYDLVKKTLETHKWGSINGWDVWHGGKRGFMGKCLPKDLYAFTSRFKLPLLDKVREINKKIVSETI